MGIGVSLLHPEYVAISGPDGVVTQGADQDWFPTVWQQRAGCGPTTASVIAAYLARAHPDLRPLCPEDVGERTAFQALMCRMWEYVTPVMYGLNRPEMMRDGFAAYAKAQGVALSPAMLAVPAARTRRPGYEEVARFVGGSLARECPVAFLNLHNGGIKGLDGWHWVTIVGLEDTRAVILDSGARLEIDLALWLARTRRRGGFVAPLGGA